MKPEIIHILSVLGKVARVWKAAALSAAEPKVIITVFVAHKTPFYIIALFLGSGEMSGVYFLRVFERE